MSFTTFKHVLGFLYKRKNCRLRSTALLAPETCKMFFSLGQQAESEINLGRELISSG